MSSPHVLSDREHELLILVDRSFALAEADYNAEKGAGMSAVRVDQYEMILRNLKSLRQNVASGHAGGSGGFSRFADEWGRLSDDLMDSFSRLDAFMQDEF